MEIKWTPWRGQYVKGRAKSEGCVLCAKHEEHDDVANLVLGRGATCYVMMNLYPYNPGHLMILPYAHTSDFAGLDAATSAELMALTQQAATILGAVLRPAGFNLGMNLGQVGGAGIAEHLHMHIVPRWNGDANFMPVIGGTKLIPEAIDDTYAALRPGFAALGL